MQIGAAICWNCNALLSGLVRFCGQCGTRVGRNCPHCEAVLAAGAEFCSACGTILEASENEFGRRTALHLVTGERKHVTLLFADMVDSTALLSGLGPERGRWLIETVVGRMKDAVEAFGGIVNQVAGDGIMALFGAPRALEDNALRACHAALRMQQTMQIQETERADRLAETFAGPVSIRVGLHSGEVVVAETGRGLDHHYTAFGVAAHTAARMEQAARPGQVLMSAQTFAQVAGRVEVAPQGRLRLKGLAEPVESFLLLRVFEASASVPRRGTGTSFIGRRAIMGLLGSLATGALAGLGCTAVVAGEPGSGKSRLCREILRQAEGEFRIVRTGGHSFLPLPPYGSLVDCLRALLPGDIATPAGGQAWLATLSGETLAHGRVLLPLLTGDGSADPEAATLSFRERQTRVADAAVHMLRRAAAEQPILIFIDDLQWIDRATSELLGVLARRIADARILVLANARTGGVPASIRDAEPTLIALDTFTEEETGRFLETVLAPSQVGPAAKRRLYRLTGGNAFFLEEVVKILGEDGPLAGEAADVEVPGTVQDLLAMRIDHLPAPSKLALQAAAVLGTELEGSHLAGMLGLPPANMTGIVATLCDGGFLLPAGEDGSERLAFRHVLGRDAAYAGLLQENRHHLHASAMDVLEAAGTQDPGVLAFHARSSARWDKAHRYSAAAGRVAIDRAAPREAMGFFDDALDSLSRIPADAAAMRAELDLRFLIRNTLFSLGRAGEIGPHLQAARRLAEALGDQGGQARALCQSAHHAWQMGRWREAIEAGRLALKFATAIEDLGLQVSSIFFMGLAALASGQFRNGATLLQRNLALLPDRLATERFGFVSICSVVSGAYSAICLTELGQFAQAERAAAVASEIALRAGSAFDRIQADLALAGVALMQGAADHRIALLEDALSLCRSAAVAVMLPRTTAALALAYALAGRAEDALALAADREEQSGVAVRAMSQLAASEAQLLGGDPAAARARAKSLVLFGRRTDQTGAQAWGLLVLACCHLAGGRWRKASAAAAAAHRIALEREMRPLAVRAALVQALAGKNRDELPAAIEACESSGMAAWVARTMALLPINKC